MEDFSSSGAPVEGPFSFRPATSDDLPALTQIENRAHAAFGGIAWTSEQFQEEMEKPYSQFLVLTDDETDEIIVGYFVAWKLYDELQLLNLVVDLPYRGLGFGKRMLSRLCGQAHRESLRRVVLDVRKSNLPAISLYQRCGFSIAHIRKGFYSNGEDAYQMELDLSDTGKILNARFDSPDEGTGALEEED